MIILRRIKLHLFHLAIQSFIPFRFPSKGEKEAQFPPFDLFIQVKTTFLFNWKLQWHRFSPDEKGFPWQTGWSTHHRVENKRRGPTTGLSLSSFSTALFHFPPGSIIMMSLIGLCWMLPIFFGVVSLSLINKRSS